MTAEWRRHRAARTQAYAATAVAYKFSIMRYLSVSNPAGRRSGRPNRLFCIIASVTWTPAGDDDGDDETMILAEEEEEEEEEEESGRVERESAAGEDEPIRPPMRLRARISRLNRRRRIA